MSRRVVLRLTEYSEYLQALKDFVGQAETLGAGPRARFHYQVHPELGPVLVLEIPESAVAALERAERPPVLSKQQQAVRDQREARDRAVAAGEQVPGHVPPVKKLRRKAK